MQRLYLAHRGVRRYIQVCHDDLKDTEEVNMSCKGNIGVSGNDPKQWVAESDEANLPLYHSVGLPGPLVRGPKQRNDLPSSILQWRGRHKR